MKGNKMTTTAEIVNFSKEIREGKTQICPLTVQQMKKNVFLTYITFNINALKRALFELEENANYITLRFGRKQMCRINTLDAESYRDLINTLIYIKKEFVKKF